jgi:tetratricopeptide (TPR) repeat protein
MPQPTNKISQFWQELKRRKVIKVIAMYAATAFIIMEAADIMLPRLGLPDWTVTFIIILLIVGFPISVILSWIFDVTPEGIKKTEPVEVEKEKEVEIKSAKRKIRVSDIIIAVLVVVVMILAFPKVFKKDKSLFDKAFENKISIAVFPFMNNTGDSSYDHWEYGISELLINALSTSDELTVIDNQTIIEVIDNAESIHIASIGPDIAKEVATRVKVESYIDGNYLLAGSTFRINLKLIDTKSSEVLKTDYVEGKADSIFSMVGSLSNAIKNYLEITVMGDDMDREKEDYVTTNSPEAYGYFIQGMEAFWKGSGNTPEYFQEAIKIDSRFISAYFFLSLAWRRQGDLTNSKEAMLKAYEGKDRLSRKMQLWLSAFMSQYIDKNPYKTINYFKQVTEIDPLSRQAWLWLGTNYNQIENYEDALLSFEQILKLNKQLGSWKNLYFYGNFGITCRNLEKYNTAQKIYKEGLQLFPEAPGITLNLAIFALLQNDTTSANHYIDQYKSYLIETERFPEPIITSYVGYIYEEAGQFKKAEDLYRQALEVRINQGNNIDTIFSGNHLFWHYEVLGNMLIDNNINVEEGMEYIQKALDLSKESEESLDHTYILSQLGWGYYKQGKYEEALQALKQAEEGSTLYNHTLHKRIQEVEQALASQNQ